MNLKSDFGFSSFFENQCETLLQSDSIPARVIAEHRDRYTLWAESGVCAGKVSGKIHQLGQGAKPAVGDWVTCTQAVETDSTCMITNLFERRTALTRGSAGENGRIQVIAANIDLVFVVTGLDGNYNLHRIERYLARIWASGAQPAVILNKVDMCDTMAVYLDEIESNHPGVPVLIAAAKLSMGLDEIRAQILPGQTVAFVGSSGVGKSTIINSLAGEQQMATNEVRSTDHRGRHTTTHRELFLLPGGGMVIDTPGMRELQLSDTDGIDLVFSDIEELSKECRFQDCRHDTEPGCAVKKAVEDGRLPAERLEHYHKLELEAQAYERRHDEHLRRTFEKRFGKVVKEGKQIRRWKKVE